MDITPSTCKAARAVLGWTAAELAELAGVSVSALRNFESGKVRMMAANRREIVRCLEGFGINLAELGEGRVSVAGPASEVPFPGKGQA